MERQIWESVTIDRMSPEDCLNLESEWGQLRTPGLVNKDREIRKKRPERTYKGRRKRKREEIGEENRKVSREEAPLQPRKRVRK